VWEYYQREVKKQEEGSKTKEGAPSPSVAYQKHILDKLELDNMCCRRHLLGHVDLIDIL
jgi:DNA-directed RNA polymerase subunit N (RpoN/RPB10)